MDDVNKLAGNLANDSSFWLRFLEALRHDVGMPRLSVEIVYDVLLFPEVLEALVQWKIGSSVKYVTKEFPIRKYRLFCDVLLENSAKNISADFLMCAEKTVYLVELKTEMGSKGRVQLEHYQSLVEKSRADRGLIGLILIDDYKMIRERSKQKAKYDNQFKEFQEVLPEERCKQVEDIKVIYIQPEPEEDKTGAVVSLNEFACVPNENDSDLVKAFKALWIYTQGIKIE